MPAKIPVGAPGADAVEALSSPMFARFLEAALGEAVAALDAKYRVDGPATLSPTQTMALDALLSLGAQLVTATTPVGDGAK